MDYIEKCPRPIPIGKQKFAYQCENIVIEPLFGSANLRAFIPHNAGKEPYPNDEKDLVAHYDLKIEKHTANSIGVSLTKKYKDGSELVYDTTMSFADFANQLFTNFPVNLFRNEAPPKPFQ
jgi:hypothetical protein